MSSPSFTTPKCMLMHATLAYISPELSTLNDIILCGHNPIPRPIDTPQDSRPSTQGTPLTSRIPRLPTEILLLIREWLVPEVAVARQIQSQNALRTYERALRDLLCEDCVLYNLDIYGPNIWEWEQFTSACSCREPGVPKGYRSSSAPSERRVPGSISLRDGHHSISISTPVAATHLNPKQFLDAEHWLEWHLSREAALCVGYHGHDASSLPYNSSAFSDSASDSASEATPPVCTALAIDIDIWHLVASVLREFGCEVVREPEDAMSAHQRAARREHLRKSGLDFVRIVPQQTQEKSSVVDPEELQVAFDGEWDMQRRLHRAYRELGLWSDYPDMFSKYLSHISTLPSHPPRVCFGTETTDTYPKARDFIILKYWIDALRHFLGVSFAIATGIIAVPLTLTTFALTMVCYYSRPRSFRML